jgi:TetR/AcrR family transcriptional repressor of nem operon
VRYSADHKQKTYERIVETGARRFREQGFDGVSIGALMSELELTHGGFYRHFADKESLYTHAIRHSIEQVKTDLMDNTAAMGGLTLRNVITSYLSMEHCNDVGSGCPVAALSSEIAHQSDTVQSAFNAGLQLYKEAFLPLIDGATDDERERKFLVLFSGMAGALSAARAIPDATTKQHLLDAARDFYTQAFCE